MNRPSKLFFFGVTTGVWISNAGASDESRLSACRERKFYLMKLVLVRRSASRLVMRRYGLAVRGSCCLSRAREELEDEPDSFESSLPLADSYDSPRVSIMFGLLIFTIGVLSGISTSKFMFFGIRSE